jgi:hypothetical protein
MIDQQQQRDHAEEAAVRADADRENREEQAHADLVAETVRHLRQIGTDAQIDARETVARLAEEVNLRLAPNAHRYELLARQQHTALLAATTAAAIEETGSYDLGSVADGVGTAYRAQHTNARRVVVVADLADRALVSAIDRVRLAVEEVAQHAADAATDRAIAEHEADLAARDAL